MKNVLLVAVGKKDKKLFVLGRSQNTTHTVQGAWCTWTSRWLLPESRWLVITEHTQCRPWVMRLPVECMHQSGECIEYILLKWVQ